MRLKMLVALAILCMAIPAGMLAQNTQGSQQKRVVTGRVTDEKGQPLEQVTITETGTDNRTFTNDAGTYSIALPSGPSELTFTMVGQTTKKVKVGDESVYNVTLEFNLSNLDDVVVVGYGTKKRTNVLGAIASIKSEDVVDLAVANLGQALINRLPGVGVNFASGKPGAPARINIRGASVFPGASLSGTTSEPLYVIDGIIATSTDFDNLDASVVEDINFLKDASAAIYGAAGAKGVVLVTTKKGKVGKPKITYSGYYGNNNEAVQPQILSAYEHARLLNTGYELTGAPQSQRFSQEDLDFLATNPYKSWYDELWKASNIMRHTVNISGGSDRITFFAGGNYFRQDGNYGGITVQKYGFRMGTTAKIAEGLTANVIFASDFSSDNRNTLKGASNETDNLSIRALYLTPKWVPLTQNGIPVGWNGPNPPGNWNPVALFNSGNYKRSDAQGLSVNASLEYKPNYIKGLTARVQYGKLSRNSGNKEYNPPYLVGNFVRTGQNGLLFSDQLNANTPFQRIGNSDQLAQGTDVTENYQIIGTLAYGFETVKSDFDIMVGFDQSSASASNIFIYKNTQLVADIDQFWAFSNVGQTIRNPTFEESVKRSFISRANYSYMGKYMAELITRYDASSNFAPENRWGLFPTLMLGWKVSDENFFRDILPQLNYMKIRTSFGMVGEDRVNNRLWQERYTQTTGMLFGTNVTNGLDPNVSPNPAITWEKSRTFNIGFDAAFARNKFNFTYDYFHRFNYDGYDRLDNGVLPPTVGVNTAVVNYGQSISWGHEFSFGYNTKFNKDWGIQADINFGFSNSQLQQAFYNEAFLGQYGTDPLSIAIGRDPRKYNGGNYGYLTKGIFRTQGEVDAVLAKNPNYRIGGQKPQIGFMDYEDINGDGQINDLDITTMNDRTTPWTTFGMTFTVSYKTLKLQTNMNLRVGGKVNFDSEARKAPVTNQNAPSFWMDSWSNENPNAKYPRADAPLARENSTLWVVNGTQSRINNMVLSYALPTDMVRRLSLPAMRIMLTGTNLWNIINPYKYKDPYTSNFAEYPTLRSISVGLNLSL
jgi:TonB-linked SusC/RagA family outer membrane protein